MKKMDYDISAMERDIKHLITVELSMSRSIYTCPFVELRPTNYVLAHMPYVQAICFNPLSTIDANLRQIPYRG